MYPGDLVIARTAVQSVTINDKVATLCYTVRWLIKRFELPKGSNTRQYTHDLIYTTSILVLLFIVELFLKMYLEDTN